MGLENFVGFYGQCFLCGFCGFCGLCFLVDFLDFCGWVCAFCVVGLPSFSLRACIGVSTLFSPSWSIKDRQIRFRDNSGNRTQNGRSQGLPHSFETAQHIICSPLIYFCHRLESQTKRLEVNKEILPIARCMKIHVQMSGDCIDYKRVNATLSLG